MRARNRAGLGLCARVVPVLTYGHIRRILGALACAMALGGCHDLAGPAEPQAKPEPVGPIADYAPMAAIVTHDLLPSVAPGLPPKLTELLGARHVVAHHAWRSEEAAEEIDRSALWMRDYEPIFVRDRDGSVRALRYLSANAHRSSFLFELGAKLRTSELPILHENGNLIAVGDRVFVTEALVEHNAEAHSEKHLTAAGYRPRTRQELLQLLSAALGVAPARIVVLPRMPHEASGHVDQFLLALDDRTVIVPEIEPRALASTAGREREVGGDVQAFLDEQAAALGALGLDVLRLPMLAPALSYEPNFQTGGNPASEAFELVLFTPSNMLLVQTDGRRVALLPGFINVAEEAMLAALIARYTRSWEEALAARGWETHVVDAAQLVGQLGLFRCVTAAVPE
jgi:hypothetical protein